MEYPQIVAENESDIRKQVKEDWPGYKMILMDDTKEKWKEEKGTIYNVVLKQTLMDKLYYHFNRIIENARSNM